MSGKTIAVTGATGQQGSAVARRLLAEGWQVRALTRDADKPVAKELAALGADLAPGDMDNRAELDAAVKGADAVFSVQNYWLPTVGFDGEVRQGKLVVDAAKTAGIQNFIYSSVGAAHRGEGQKHFASKHLIEQYLQASGLTYTILRPAAFMENYNFPWTKPAILNGAFPSMGLPADKPLQLIAVEDIAPSWRWRWPTRSSTQARRWNWPATSRPRHKPPPLSPKCWAARWLLPRRRPTALCRPTRCRPWSASSAAKATTPTSPRCASAIPAC